MGLAIKSLLVDANVPCMLLPVPTPAGGLVRVQRGDQVLLDKSYTRGTGACSLKTKLAWAKNGRKGPPPFKAPWPEPLETKLAKLAGALGVELGPFEPAMEYWTKTLAEHKCADPRLTAMKAALDDTARRVIADVVAEDTAAVEAVMAELEQ